MSDLGGVIDSYEMVFPLGDSVIRYRAPSEESIRKFDDLRDKHSADQKLLSKTEDVNEKRKLTESISGRSLEMAIQAVQACVVDCEREEAVRLAAMSVDENVKRFMEICMSMLAASCFRNDHLGN